MIDTQRRRKLWEQIASKKRTCIYTKCDGIAIKSHVLQKNGILRQMSTDNHLIQLGKPNAIETFNGVIHKFKKIGVNDAYTFTGFCNAHDTAIFKPIEDQNTLDLENVLHQALFSYRGLCQELRRKQISKEYMQQAISLMPREVRPLIKANLDGTERGLLNLTFFKDEFEKAFVDNQFKSFFFSTIKIPQIELCISVALNIHEEGLTATEDYDTWKKSQSHPFTTSFINVFPYKGDSYFIIGYHSDFPCKWSIELIDKLKAGNQNITLKSLSDLIVLRLEFWAMSPTLFSKISEEKLERYRQTFVQNIFNHDEKLQTEINLFDHLE